MLLYGEIDERDIPANERRAVEVFLVDAIERAQAAGYRVEERYGRVVIHWDDCPNSLSKGMQMRFVIYVELMLKVRCEHESTIGHLLVWVESEDGVGEWLCVEMMSPSLPIGDHSASFLMLVLFNKEMFLSKFAEQLEETLSQVVSLTLEQRAIHETESLLQQLDAGDDSLFRNLAIRSLVRVINDIGGRLSAAAIEELVRRGDVHNISGMVGRLDSRCPEVRLAAMNYLFTFQSSALDEQMLEFLATDPCPDVAERAAHLLTLPAQPEQ